MLLGADGWDILGISVSHVLENNPDATSPAYFQVWSMLLGAGGWEMVGNGVAQCYHSIDISSVFSEGLIHIYLLGIIK